MDQVERGYFSKRVLLAAVAVSAVLGATHIAEAQGRPDTRNYTCQAAQDFVKQRGGVTMNTGTNTYQRFVSISRECLFPNERAWPRYVPTKDNPHCALNTCQRRRGSDGIR
ncbi:MAG: hypothetical protein AAGJ94_06645 [Pseudomonadota bacterium]